MPRGIHLIGSRGLWLYIGYIGLRVRGPDHTGKAHIQLPDEALQQNISGEKRPRGK
jgi:hypothetical protein